MIPSLCRNRVGISPIASGPVCRSPYALIDPALVIDNQVLSSENLKWRLVMEPPQTQAVVMIDIRGKNPAGGVHESDPPTGEKVKVASEVRLSHVEKTR